MVEADISFSDSDLKQAADEGYILIYGIDQVGGTHINLRFFRKIFGVNPDEVDDLSTITIARQIKEEIENKLSYPGTIKVTVIREMRAVDVAK